MKAVSKETTNPETPEREFPGWIVIAVFVFTFRGLREFGLHPFVACFLASIVANLVFVTTQGGALRERLKDALMMILFSSNFAAAMLFYPPFFAKLFPSYIANGVSLFLLIVPSYLFLAGNGFSKKEFVRWVAGSLCAAILWGTGWWLIPIMYSRWQW